MILDTSEYPIVGQSSFTGVIGVSRRDITPPQDIFARNWGAATFDQYSGVHKPLTLTCISLQAGQNTAPHLLFGADLGWWKSKSDELFVRQQVLERLQIPEDRLLFCLSHTHSGPGLFSEDRNKPGGEHIEPYLQHLADAMVNAGTEALERATPATLDWGYGVCNLAVNRDLPEIGSDRFAVGYNPTVKADSTLLVGRISDSSGNVTGVIVNYACHPTTLAWDNHLLSPDFVGGLRDVIEAEKGVYCLFLQGASGDLSPREQYSGDTGLADAFGRQLGYSVRATLEGMLPAGKQLQFTGTRESGAHLGIWSQTIALASQKISSEVVQVHFLLKNLPTLAEIEASWQAETDHVVRERLWRQRGIRKTVGDGDTSEMPLWVWKIGDAILVAQPNEAYSALQIELRELFPDRAIVVINIANGYAGYLPPADLYTCQMYSVWQTPFAEGSLELLTSTAANTIKQLL